MSKPFNTSPPTLELANGSLVAHNGGFMSYSADHMDFYEFEFKGDGKEIQSGSGNVCPLPASGSVFTAQVRAGVTSKYVRQDGTVAYDTTEWSDWFPTNEVHRAAPPAPKPQPTPHAQPNAPAALAVLENVALAELRATTGYKNGKAKATPAAFAASHMGKTEAAIVQAIAFLKGT
jgi:hypothetical protein